MTYSVLVSRTFQKQFHALESETQNRIRTALGFLGRDPLTPRSGADIRPLAHTSPKKYRLRVGEFRVIYTVEGRIVKVIEVFPREKGY